MELNALVTMTNRQIEYSFSLNIGWSWTEEWPNSTHHETAEAASSLCLTCGAKQSVMSAGRESQTVTGFHERMQTSGINVTVYFEPWFLPFNSARPDLVWVQTWRVSWLVQDPFWRCVVSCQVDKCVIVCCLTLFSEWCIGRWCKSLCSNKISTELLDKHGLLSKGRETLFQKEKKKGQFWYIFASYRSCLM